VPSHKRAPSSQLSIQTSRGFISTDITHIVVDLCRTFEPNHPISIVDYGTGQASLLTMISQVAKIFQQRTFVFTGYDPHLDPTLGSGLLLSRLIAASHGSNHRFEFCSTLPHHADIVCAHFSLHHTPNLTIACREISTMNPRHLLVADYDFTDPPIDIDGLIAHFEQTQAGRDELALFVHQAGGNVTKGHIDCWKFHLHYGFKDYLDAIEKAVGNVKTVTLPQKRFSFEKRKFLIAVEL